MKTTIELPDSLVRELKELAQTQGVTMRELMLDGLRREIERRRQPPPEVDFAFTTVGGEGINPDLDPSLLTQLAYDLPR